ncbi:type III-B CRISPR-associated protein Cas10/Cmr2 [Methylacidimicrobium tartarophylax]|uniref:Uncharacterized protein n=1 Tax=Methylacidimicrobium tartarophylax TaxID=1041768 RepID=A0A5E6M6V4_9BACT|nr:type III-B CRISPR-associated protein Cas10/Cmr2 [Methylacidimicrobium tartarophylax]VVM05289.1 hypothetical protein MAMT_00563 [Methylacidimicrobium tartarophylax]
MNLWQRKLLAFLHDPPTKPFNIREHREIAEPLVRAAGFDPADARWFFDKISDHVAAAADRILFPKPSVLSSVFRGDVDSPFRHPLGGGHLVFTNPIDPSDAEGRVAACQPTNYEISRIEDRSFCHFPTRIGKDWANFFLHWRLWPEFAARSHASLAFLPADTRIPDHTIWTHCAITSALQGCVEISTDDPNAEIRSFKPAFLLVHVSPVQEFIAQARTTRDLWSGSYLLSYLVAHGLKAITDRIGPDAILFPSLRGQPLFDFLHKEELYDRVSREGSLWSELHVTGEQILTPNIPNRFLAVVPAEKAKDLAEAAEKGIRNCLKEISEQCLAWFEKKRKSLDEAGKARWRQQVSQFLSVHWQTWPWEQDLEEALSAFEALPAGRKAGADLRQTYDAARKGIREANLDPRNYCHRSWRESGRWRSEIVPDKAGLPVVENTGFGWSAHYAMADFLLAARRNTRDFPFWSTPQDLSARHGAIKDVLSGKEECIGSEEWQRSLIEIPDHFFNGAERLGAMNLIKRVWHKAHLEAKFGGQFPRSPRFDSVPAVVAADWIERVQAKLGEEGQANLCTAFDAFGKALDKAEQELDFPYPRYAEFKQTRRWVRTVTPAVFHESELRRRIRERQEQEEQMKSPGLERALRELASLRAEAGGAPGRYFAVLALDGDSMGKWLSGEKAPELRGQLSKEAADYFAQQHPGAKEPGALHHLLDNGKRLLTPSFHLELSTALVNFALHLAGRIVDRFQGQLIYAGGDDVLALLPARNVLKCASVLRKAFRGDPALPKEFEGVLEAVTEQWGFVGLDGRWPERQRNTPFPRGYHVLVPGQRADVSAGIAIGHMHSPLQIVVEAARAAEKRAKSHYKRSAFAVSLFKRSGEILEWGANWDSGAIELLEQFASLTREKKLSGRFPYALASLLRRYEPVEGAQRTKIDSALYSADLKFVATRQAAESFSPAEREELLSLAGRYLENCGKEERQLNDFLGPFLTTAFLEDARD